jgi:hypothetical protein
MFWCVGDGVWQHRTSLDEFGFGEHAACGPAAHELLLANLADRTPTYANMRAICDRDAARGWYSSTSGQTFTNLVNDFLDCEQYPVDHLTRHNFVGSGYSASDVQACIEACNGRNAGLIVQVGFGYQLPHNEANIKEHFIAVLAYNSVTGNILVANPDREPHSMTPDWISVSSLVRAVPQAFLMVEKVEAMVATTPAGWHDDGTTLTAPNGIGVVTAKRDFVRNWPGGWEADNWPLESSRVLNPVELGNAAIGGGSRQIFRYRVLAWRNDQQRVYVMWSGQELLAWINKPIPPPLPAPKPDTTAILNNLASAETMLGAAIDGIKALSL